MPILSANLGPWTLEDARERRMIARGQYIPEAAIWLDNRPRPVPPAGSVNAQAGFYLMMPLRLEGRDEVLWVNRGWAPRNNENRETLPPVKTPNQLVHVEGVVFAQPGKVYELGGGNTPVDNSKPRIEQKFAGRRKAKWLESIPLYLA